jgi:AcrR family transcriptional regulator
LGVRERRARQKSLLRQEILDAARDILVREGYEGLSMRKVAEKIDYSPTAIYLHFKDRDDLLFHVSEQLMAGLVRELQSLALESSDPLVALRKGLRRYVDFALAHPQHYIASFMIPQGQDPEVAARFKQPDTMSMQAFGLLLQLVGECVRQKKLRKVEVENVSRALWAAMHGITSLLIAIPTFDWGNRDRVIDQLIAILIDGIKAADAPAARPRKPRLDTDRASDLTMLRTRTA